MEAVPDALSTASPVLLTFGLVALAEMGDKSQLMTMALARRGNPWAVFGGAGSAFVLLNLLAVWVGAGLGTLVPAPYDDWAVAALFAWFGIGMLRDGAGEDGEEPPALSDGHLFRTSALAILVAEFGDKTQLSVAGLAVEHPAWSVWLGGTLALLVLTGLAVGVGCKLLCHVPIALFHRVGGVLFLLIALFLVF